MTLSRREFLGALAAGAAAGLPAVLSTGPLKAATEGAGGLPAAPVGPSYALRSRLLSVVNPVVIKGPMISEKYLARMFEVGLTQFCGVSHTREAWRRLVQPGEKIAIKFNRCGAKAIGTTGAVLKALLASMAKADIKPEQILLLDVTPVQQRKSGARPPILAYQDEPVRLLGRREHLSAALDWADCLINVPFIKDHHLAGVTCAMKNLSHGLIKTPAQWHGDQCRKSIPHLFSLPAIRGKLRLTICNALRIVFDGGPVGKPEGMTEYSRLIFATDAVALDAHAARVVDRTRGARGLKDLAEDGRPPAFLAVARDMKLGQPNLDRIEVTELEA